METKQLTTKERLALKKQMWYLKNRDRLREKSIINSKIYYAEHHDEIVEKRKQRYRLKKEFKNTIGKEEHEQFNANLRNFIRDKTEIKEEVI